MLMENEHMNMDVNMYMNIVIRQAESEQAIGITVLAKVPTPTV
jgi:hypothetical protein